MDSNVPMRKRGTSRLVVGVPEGQQQQIRARIETSDGDVIVLQEATLAALVQAYMDVFTHPSTHALELKAAAVPSGGTEPKHYQLVPGTTHEDRLRQELAHAPRGSFLDEDDDDTQVLRQPEPPATSEPLADPAGTFGNPETQTMERLENHPTASRIGWRTQDDGPVFGDIPTQHSGPRVKAPNANQTPTETEPPASTDDLD